MDVVSSIDIVHTCQMQSIVIVLLQVQFYLVWASRAYVRQPASGKRFTSGLSGDMETF